MLDLLPNPAHTAVPQGLKYFEQLDTLLKRLHDVGCERDSAHNRKLHYDQYCMLILLSFSIPLSNRCEVYSRQAN
jgi:hypothetical protein